MKKQQMQIIIISIILILLTFYVCKLRFNMRSLHSLRVENILLREGFFHSYDFESVRLDFNKKIFNFHLGELTLNEIVKNENTLALFINVGACDRCVYDNIEMIKKIEQNSKLNILIGISGIDKRQFNSFVNNYSISDNSYLIPDYYFSGFINNPVVYFVIDNLHELKCFYAPNDAFSILTNDYLHKINGLYE